MSKVECVMQDGPKDCGVCSLLTIIKLYGGDVSKEYLREITHTTKEGVSAYNLLEAAKTLGFDGRGIKTELSQIDEYMLPCIAHTVINDMYQHFVVLYQINTKRKVLVILDPARGKVKMSYQEFEKISTNQFLYLKPKRKLPVLESKNVLHNTLFFIITKNKRILFFIFFLSCIYMISNMIIAFHFKFLMEYVFPFSVLENAKMISIFIIFFILFQLFAYFGRQYALSFLEKKISNVLMECMIQQIITLPYPYYKNKTTGEMVARLNDLEEIKQFITNFLGTFFLDLLCILFMLIALFILNFELSMLMLLMIMIAFSILLLLRPKQDKMMKTIYQDNAKINSLFIESIQGVETVKGMHLESFLLDKICHGYYLFLDKIKKLQNSYHFTYFLKENIIQIGFVLLLWKGSIMVINKEFTVVSLIVFQNLYYYFLKSIQNVFSFYLESRSIKIVFRRLEELFDVKNEVFLEDKNKKIKTIKGDILCKGLTYSYKDDHILLKDINLHITSGEKIVLYGASGSGKSTLAKLLFRYYQVAEDSIFLDGVGINHYLLEDVRKYVTYVSQNEILFTDTIYHNIVLEQDLNYDTFLEVCSITKVDEIVSDQLLGYDKLIEENGFNLSGGERQRIVLARALLKSSSIYIFDEAFNQIDVKKERVILENIFYYLKDKTVIIISHRDHNQDLFDRIIKMEEGKCIENVMV